MTLHNADEDEVRARLNGAYQYLRIKVFLDLDLPEFVTFALNQKENSGHYNVGEKPHIKLRCERASAIGRSELMALGEAMLHLHCHRHPADWHCVGLSTGVLLDPQSCPVSKFERAIREYLPKPLHTPPPATNVIICAPGPAPITPVWIVLGVVAVAAYLFWDMGPAGLGGHRSGGHYSAGYEDYR